MKTYSYQVFLSGDYSRTGKRTWQKSPVATLLVPENHACLAGAEDQAIELGLASQMQFNTPLNGCGYGHANGVAAKVVFAKGAAL
jgi:hypothetical protein